MILLALLISGDGLRLITTIMTATLMKGAGVPGWTSSPGVALSFRLTNTIPEPATFALLSLGLAGLGFTRRRMKAQVT